MEVRRVQADEWQALRDVRLRALADAPDAFATTHAEASLRPDQWWIDWTARSAATEGQAMFLAWDGDQAVGIAGAYGEPERFDVISMWVDPAVRGHGVGAALLDAAIAFAGDAPVYLSVTETNEPAKRLYARRGFEPTGVTEQLASNPALAIYELRLRS
jgi:ribosomal protein S18 acetylase RimI-like enzyme